MIRALQEYWAANGCVILPPYDMEVGAGTFTPPTFLRSLGAAPFSCAYVAPSRRPTDGRYGENPNRLYKFHQFQVVLKPSPINNQDLYLGSLEAIGIDRSKHDIRFVHDDWESPTLGAYGLGWEVWVDGMEATQFTYFQTVGQFKVHPITVEYAYGIERLAMYSQNVDNVYDLKWNETMTYGELFLSDEREWGKYHFELADRAMWKRHFEEFEAEAIRLLDEGLVQPALDFVMKASHAFNALDAIGAISVSQRASAIGRIRHLSHRCAKNYLALHPPQEAPTFEPQLKLAQLPLPQSPQPYLLEIGSEELPASFIPGALSSLKTLIEKLLSDHAVAHGQIEVFGAPRRLALLIHDLAPMSTPASTERRGPALDVAFDESGAPSRAALGFFKGLGLEPLKRSDIDGHSQIFCAQSGSKTYLFARVQPEPKPSTEILSSSLPTLLTQVAFPKKMRWNALPIQWARPIHWIVSLLGSEVVPFEFGPILAGRSTRGHRQRAGHAEIELTDASAYCETLEQHAVIPCPKKRREKIEALLKSQSDSHIPLEREALLSEVTHLVEWPDLLIGSFDADFLAIPHQVLVCEMIDHQRVFPLLKDDKLSNRFAIITDQNPSDQIRLGNERVITARLSDGRFLYQSDLSRSLKAMRTDLANMTFFDGLGTMLEKCERLEKHVAALHTLLGLGDLKVLEGAAHFCKADLTSKLVGEFPELQGIAGANYAEHAGMAEIAPAIAEHWLPAGEGDSLPKTPEGALLALADKLDNLLACFSSGKIPTSTKDPYGLRRQAIGVLRICFEQRVDLPLRSALEVLATHMPQRPDIGAIEAVITFISGRMEGLLMQEGYAKTEIAATIATPELHLCDFLSRLVAVHSLRKSADFSSLTEVFKRAHGQLKDVSVQEFLEELTSEPAENALAEALATAEQRFAIGCEQGDYRAALDALGALQEPLGTFFETVRVQCDEPDLRTNRLALLGRILAMSQKLTHLQDL
jgi:glycyl-tRNA synthetase